MKLPLSAIALFVSATNNQVFAQTNDRCFCVSADNTSCPEAAPEILAVVDQVVCFGGYPGGCTVFFNSITCMWNTENSDNDAYSMATMASCNDGCMPHPWPSKPEKPAAEAPLKEEKDEVKNEISSSEAPSDAPEPPPATETNGDEEVTEMNASEDHEGDSHDHDHSHDEGEDHGNEDSSAAFANFNLGGGSLMPILLLGAAINRFVIQ